MRGSKKRNSMSETVNWAMIDGSPNGSLLVMERLNRRGGRQAICQEATAQFASEKSRL
jgi:hypothetical protein